MKKAFLFLLTALIVLPLFATVSVEAAETGEGPFIPVYSGAQLETIVADGKNKDGQTIPIAGYYYDFAGFHLKSPVYSKSSTPFTQISTRDTFDLTKNNDPAGHVLSVEFTVDSFGYDGGIGKDEWICLSITDKQNVVPGGATYQDGMFILLRGTGDGLVWIQPHLDSGKTFKECPKAFAKNVEVPMDANGREVYTFTVDYIANEWKIYVNNADVTPDMVTLSSGATMASIFSSFSDAAYFGITAQTGFVNETAPESNVIELSIQQYNSAVPAGTDSAEPKNNDTTFAPLVDSATVPANKPAILWDSKKTTFGDYTGMGFTFTEKADGSVHIVTDETETPYIVWTVKPDVSYKAEDFPIICIASRDLISISGYAYYCAGDVLAPEDQWRMNTYYNEYELGDGWFLSFIDLSYLWDGRINALRIGFSMKNFEAEFKEFDIGFMGAFRSEEEGIAFAYDYLKPMGLTQTAPQTEATSAPTPVTTAAPSSVTTSAPADTSAVPSDVTTAAATGAPADTTAASGSGCGSLIAVGVFLPLIAGAAYVMMRKKD